jgi:hypothetical protein
MDFGIMEEKYFYVEDWTGVIGLKPLEKIGFLARRIFLCHRHHQHLQLGSSKILYAISST